MEGADVTKYSKQSDVVNGWKHKGEFLEKIVSRQLAMNQEAFQTYLSVEKKITDVIMANERKCLFNYHDILEMTEESMSKVLGDAYRSVDKYQIRARMPSPPYLFVSRILNVNASYGRFEAGSSIEAEYDISDSCILKVSRRTVSSVVLSEAAHIGIFLAGYMGIDAYSSGQAKFRITDVSTRYVSEQWPQINDTIRMKFVIDRLIRGENMTLLFCSFKVYLENELIIEAKETGGFFRQETLNMGAGIQATKHTVLHSSKAIYDDIYAPVTKKYTFNKAEVFEFLRGNYVDCFGAEVANSNMHYCVTPEAMFIEDIVELSETGGEYNLGYAIAKINIDENFWPFKCHFKNDPVLPGTIMLEGLNQTITFFQTCMGLYNTKKPFKTQMKTGYNVKTKFRGEVKPGHHTLQYRIDPKLVQKKGSDILFITEGKVYCDGLQVIEQNDVAMIIKQ